MSLGLETGAGVMGNETGKVVRDLKTEGQFGESRLQSVGIVKFLK